MKKIIAFCLLFLPLIIQAQRLEFGALIGFHSDHSHFENNNWQDGRFSNPNTIGFTLGPVVRARIAGPFSIQAGILGGITGISSSLYLNYKGGSRDINQLNFTGRTWYGNIPLRLMYSFGYSADSGKKFTIFAGANIGFTGAAIQSGSLEAPDPYEAVMQVKYQNMPGVHLTYAAGFQFENKLPSGNSIAYGLEFRIGRDNLAASTVNYSDFGSNYVADLSTSGPDVLLQAVYFWSAGHKDKTATGFHGPPANPSF